MSLPKGTCLSASRPASYWNLTLILLVWSGHSCPLPLTLIFVLTFGFEFDLDLDFDFNCQGHGFKSLPCAKPKGAAKPNKK